MPCGESNPVTAGHGLGVVQQHGTITRMSEEAKRSLRRLLLCGAVLVILFCMFIVADWKDLRGLRFVIGGVFPVPFIAFCIFFWDFSRQWTDPNPDDEAPEPF